MLGLSLVIFLAVIKLGFYSKPTLLTGMELANEMKTLPGTRLRYAVKSKPDHFLFHIILLTFFTLVWTCLLLHIVFLAYRLSRDAIMQNIDVFFIANAALILFLSTAFVAGIVVAFPKAKKLNDVYRTSYKHGGDIALEVSASPIVIGEEHDFFLRVFNVMPGTRVKALLCLRETVMISRRREQDIHERLLVKHALLYEKYPTEKESASKPPETIRHDRHVYERLFSAFVSENDYIPSRRQHYPFSGIDDDAWFVRIVVFRDERIERKKDFPVCLACDTFHELAKNH